MASLLSQAQIEVICSVQPTDPLFHTNQKILKHILLDERCASSFASVINKLLSATVTRDRGFQTLVVVLDCCCTQVLTDNAVSWLNFALSRHPKEAVKPERLLIVDKLLQTCNRIPEFRKAVATDYLANIIDTCLSVKTDLCQSGPAIACLTTCCRSYPSTCGPFKGKIEAFLLKYLDCQSSLVDMVENAGQAFHFLQQVGGAGTDGINHQNAWNTQLQKLCSTVHALCDIFFDGVDELTMYERGNDAPFEFEALPSTAGKMEVAYAVSRRLRNCVIFLGAMFRFSYPVPKVIPVPLVLGIFARGLSVYTWIDSQSSIFALLLREFHVILLKLLRIFICCLKHNLYPFAFNINKMLIDCLGRTRNDDCYRGDSDYQVAVYKSLSEWIKTAKNAFSRNFQEKLLEIIKTEIFPVEHKVVLQLNTEHEGKKSKKRKLKQADSANTSTAIEQTPVSCAFKEDVCIAALKCLNDLLRNVALDINEKLTEEYLESIVKTSLNIKSGKYVQQYKNPKCRALLLESLVCIFEQPYLKVPPPLHVAVSLLSDLAEYKASVGLSVLEKISQPVCPSLYLQRTYADQKERENDVPKDYFEPLSRTKEESKKVRIISDVKLTNDVTSAPTNKTNGFQNTEDISADSSSKYMYIPPESSKPKPEATVELKHEKSNSIKERKKFLQELTESVPETDKDKAVDVVEKINNITKVMVDQDEPKAYPVAVEEAETEKDKVANGVEKSSNITKVTVEEDEPEASVALEDDEDIEAPVNKKQRLAEEEDDDSMMDSFVDVLNDDC